MECIGAMIDVTPLHEITFRVRRRFGKSKRAPLQTVTVDAVEATDEEFQAWVCEQLRGEYIGTRLRYRLTVLEALKDVPLPRSGNRDTM